jgi:hypothetical protein
MANNLENQIDKFVKKIGKELKTTINAKSMSLIGNEAIRLMKDRIRAGYGVRRPKGVVERFKPLSPAYIKQRERIRLSQYTSAGKSNVTRSGRMIASLRVARSNQGGVLIVPVGNEEIARYVAEGGRVFNNLSMNEFTKLVRFYRQRLLRIRK